MTTNIRVRFDGSVLIPEEPVELPVGEVLEVRIERPATQAPPAGAVAPLETLADVASALPRREGPPTDRAAQHDHYLYGTPKRP